MLDNQKRKPIRSKKLRNAAKGQPCTLALPTICNHNPETTVLAHLHDETFGRGIKADDTSAIHLCSDCHRALDLHQTGLNDATLFKLLLRAIQRTIRNLVMRGIMVVPLDVEKPASTTKRKSGKKITSGQKMQSRPMRNEKFKRKLNGETVKR